MESSKRSFGVAAVILVLVGALIAVVVTAVVVAQGNRVTGTPTAGESVDRDDESDFYQLDDMPTAPEQWWSVTLADRGLSPYPSSTTSVDGDPLIYLTNDNDYSGPGQIVRFNAFTGQRKWTAELRNPSSCTPIIRGRYLPCYSSSGDPRELSYVDLQTGEVTPTLLAEREIYSVRVINDEGTEFLVATAGARPGEVTVQRGTPTDLAASWTSTYRVADERPQLSVYRKDGRGRLGYGLEPGDSVLFDLETGAEEEDDDEPYDRNLWTWSERTKIRVDPETRTFEILNADGQVVGRGTDAANNTTFSRKVGTAYESVALIGTSAYDTTTGDELWTDARLRRPDGDPLSSIDTAVMAIVNDVVVLRLGDFSTSGSLIGLDLKTGRELWRENYSSMQVQTFLDSTRWICIIDGRIRAIDTVTGDETWSLAYPGPDPDAGERYNYDETNLDKLDRSRLIVTTETTVTVYGYR